MTDDAEEDEGKTEAKKPNWAGWALGATIVYCVLIFATVAFGRNCGDPQKFCSGREAFMSLTLNEVGDFLAGAFAPLAFLWLAAAVMIQGQELAAQRQQLKAQLVELKLTREEARQTREEYKLSREVAEQAKNETAAQAATAKETAAFIKSQTAIMEQQAVERRQERQDELIDDMVDNLATQLRAIAPSFGFGFDGRVSHDYGWWTSNELPDQSDQAILYVSRRAKDLANTMDNRHRGDVLRMRGATGEDLAAIAATIDALLDQAAAASQRSLYLVATIQLEAFRERLDVIRQKHAEVTRQNS
ncbi:MAG: hypothetical protein AB7P20_18215 [Rhizobiaceae bacterium]